MLILTQGKEKEKNHINRPLHMYRAQKDFRHMILV